MRRRALLAALTCALALPLAPLPAGAQQEGADQDQAPKPIPLSALSDWLNGLTTARADFTQINPDGSISTGRLYIRRPGRIRFEYDPPDAAVVMAGGGTVAIFDGKSNEPPQQYPLKRTPLAVILKKRVDLEREGVITGITADDVSTTVTARDPEQPEIGSIELRFTADPIELRQWIITDQDGNRTTVILGDLQTGVTLDSRLFSVMDEIEKRAPGDR